MLSNKVLAKIAVCGSIVVVSTGLFLRYRLQDRVRQTDCYREALKCLRSHPGAIRQLGEPIKDGLVDIGDSSAFGSDGSTAWCRVPVKGPNTSGTLFYSTVSKNEKWQLSKLELFLDNIPDEKFTIKEYFE